MQQGKIQPVAGAIAPPPEAKPEEIVIDEPKLPEFLNMVDLTLVASYLELSPEEFVAQLEAEVQSEVLQSQLIWNYLTSHDLPTIQSLLAPYRKHAQVGEYVEKILSGEWLEQVLALIKEKTIKRGLTNA